MLVPLTNVPRDYAWGSRTLLAALEGRQASAWPEAELWFGDHPSDPSDIDDGSGRTLDQWRSGFGESGRLPFLLKLLAAASPLSIQVHPSKEQAEAGHARERSLPDGVVRNYVDDNHKPELVVALSEQFEALCGLRDPRATLRLLAALGEPARPVAERVEQGDLSAVIGWLLSGDASAEVQAVVGALGDASSTEFAAELANARRIAAAYPGDPGVVVALLMNYLVLHRGEAVFLRAGMLHAYVAGLGVELMAASDNVLRGGLTPKHIDVDELLAILDPQPGPVPVVLPVAADNGARGLETFPAPISDFELLRARTAGERAVFTPRGPAIVLAVSGEVRVIGSNGTVELPPGHAAYVTEDEQKVGLSGGELFIAQPGRA